jgi:glyoxylase-like metal-dependent hydrolase (beta-lactamase superfamily II)
MPREHIKRWTIGNVDVVRIVEINALSGVNATLFQDCDHERVRRHPWLIPYFATAEGELLVSFQAFAVGAGNRRIMVDTCIGNDKHRQAPIFHELQTSFLDDLREAGFPPESIDTVLCTHLHLDHVGWNTRLLDGRWVPTFPNARYLFGRKEWDFICGLVGAPGAELDHLPDSLQPVFDAGLVDFVEPGHQVTDEVRLEPTPGHTPGHVSVRIDSDGHRAVITGDLMHHPIQCAEPDIKTNFCADHEQARQTRRAFLSRYEERKAFVIGSHFCEPTAGWIRRHGEVWRFEGE